MVLANMGALAGLGLGVMGLVRPAAALKLVGLALDPRRPEGISEVRATYGGLFIGLELAALLTGEPMVFLAGAAAWGGAAAGRLISMLVDRAALRPNIGGTALELIIAGLHAAALIGQIRGV